MNPLRCWFVVLVLFGAGAACAHPHGTVECGARMQLDAGRLERIEVSLKLDRTHSEQAFASIGVAGDGALNAQGRGRFALAMTTMFGPAGWLIELAAGGRQVTLQAETMPLIERAADGALLLRVGLAPQSPAEATQDYEVACVDRSWYRVASFAGPEAVTSNAGRAQTISLARDARGRVWFGCRAEASSRERSLHREVQRGAPALPRRTAGARSRRSAGAGSRAPGSRTRGRRRTRP